MKINKQNIKSRIHNILEKSQGRDKLSRIFDIFIVCLILFNVGLVIIETVEGISQKYSTLLYILDAISVFLFTFEYLLRLWTCTEDKKYQRPIMGRLYYLLTFYMVIDLISILPFYIPMLFFVDLRILRLIRLFRIFRLLKVGRYSKSLKYLINTFKNKKDEIFVSLFIVVVILVISSSIIYYVERDAQPEAFASIPDAMWWGVAALSTTGYGDVKPITPMGKFLGAIITISGIGIFAVPAGIIATGFINKIHSTSRKKIKCPHCHKIINIK